MRIDRWANGIAVAAVVFGVATVVSGGRVLFGGDAGRAAAGDAVGFVLWFNAVAGLAYVAAGIAWLRSKPWAGPLAVGLAASTALVFAAFAAHVAFGGAHESRTVAAMTLRTGFWLLGALVFTRAARAQVRGPA